MSDELLFQLPFILALPLWVPVILLPQWRGTQFIAASPLVPLLPLAIYFALLPSQFLQLWAVVSRPTLDGWTEFLGTTTAAILVWAHIICFDTFVGRWMFLESKRIGLRWPIMSPLLLLTILLSPIGLVVFVVIRQIKQPKLQPVTVA